MQLPLYQIDAFAGKPFEGNPAAVCPLEEWLPDDLMQAIAAENNLAETAFFTASENGYHIRWFTPTTEVKLCGHATLASAYVLFHLLGYNKPQITFDSLSGPLRVRQDGEWLELDFPAQPPRPCDTPASIVAAFGQTPVACLRAEDYIVVFDEEALVREAQPDLARLRQLDLRGVAITAAGREQDFVCRFFAPNYGIDEDPVTGSAYTQLAPYWGKVMNKTELYARQVSSRGGNVKCRLDGNRVAIAGQAVKFLEGRIEI